MQAILFSHFEKNNNSVRILHLCFVRNLPTRCSLPADYTFFVRNLLFFQSYFYFLLKTKKIYNIISLIYISISKNALKCPCNQGLLYKKYYGITFFFVRNLPKGVRSQPTILFLFVTSRLWGLGL